MVFKRLIPSPPPPPAQKSPGAARLLHEVVSAQVNFLLHKVQYKSMVVSLHFTQLIKRFSVGGFYRVCMGRISSCEGNIMGCGEEYNMGKGKEDAISSSLLERISGGEEKKGTVIWG